jgi:hypothetical protein
MGGATERRHPKLAELRLAIVAFEECVHECADLVDDLARRSGRREQRVPSARLEPRKTRFVRGRHIGQVIQSLQAGHREPPDRALLHGRHKGRDVVESDLEIAGNQVGQRLRGDAIRNVNDRGSGELIDQFERDVRLRSVSDRAGIELARIAFRVGDEFPQVRRRYLRAADDDQRRGAQQHDRRKGALGVVAHGLVHKLVGDDRAECRNQEGVTIGGGFRRRTSADISVGARAILHDELLAERVAHSGCHRAGDDVGADAGRERTDHCHRAGRPRIGGERRRRR